MKLHALTAALLGLASIVSLPGCASTQNGSTTTGMASMNDGDIATSADATHPLNVGQHAPSAKLVKADGSPIDLAEAYRNGPVMLIFYRGGWCPYCNRHLKDLVSIDPELHKMGVRLLAVSPDQPSNLNDTLVKDELNYELISDSDVVLARAFGLAFRVDDATIKKYHGYGIDLEAASGRSHFTLPVPAVYLIDQQGVIRFAHSNPDYKSRLSAEEVLAAAKSLTGE